jgi:hypothetical protein
MRKPQGRAPVNELAEGNPKRSSVAEFVLEMDPDDLIE